MGGPMDAEKREAVREARASAETLSPSVSSSEIDTDEQPLKLLHCLSSKLKEEQDKPAGHQLFFWGKKCFVCEG